MINVCFLYKFVGLNFIFFLEFFLGRFWWVCLVVCYVYLDGILFYLWLSEDFYNIGI